MPIKGITKLYRPVRQGKIHLGVKVKTEKRCACKERTPDTKTNPECMFCLGTGFIHRPKEVDYFVLRDAPELIALYGDQPKSLNVMLPSSRFEKSFEEYLEKVIPQYLKRYKAAGLMCKGDGEMAVCIDEGTGKLVERECPCEYLEKGDCKRIGILRVRVQEIPTFNIYQLTTSSFNSIVNVNSFIRDLAEYCAVNSIDVSSVKLVLRRGEQTVQRMEIGKLSKSKHWIMTMDLDPRFYKVLSDVAVVALPQAKAKPKALPPPDESRDPLFFPHADTIVVEEETEEGREEAPEEDVNGIPPGLQPKKEDRPKSERPKEEDMKSPEYVARRQVAAEKLMSLTAEFRLAGGKINQKTWDRIMAMMSVHDYEMAIKHYEAEIAKLSAPAKKAPAPKGKQGNLI